MSAAEVTAANAGARTASRFGPHRLAAVVLLFFSCAHTAGMFSRRSRGLAGDAVLTGMKSVQFEVMGANCSWYGMYLGFGLMVTVFLLFAAAVSWQLASLSAGTRRTLAPLCWALLLSQIAACALSWSYFFVAPGVTSTVVVAVLAYERARAVLSKPAAVE